ncbi:hypothetical protein niasHT_020166 [Heterodera trifolii]|uniref:BAM-2-like concanavalin A-like domain-containing protein n=1 Tax=Heterodera trifolii TaxID=157864 RepID=A0ABD2KIT3_9BILA
MDNYLTSEHVFHLSRVADRLAFFIVPNFGPRFPIWVLLQSEETTGLVFFGVYTLPAPALGELGGRVQVHFVGDTVYGSFCSAQTDGTERCLSCAIRRPKGQRQPAHGCTAGGAKKASGADGRKRRRPNVRGAQGMRQLCAGMRRCAMFSCRVQPAKERVPLWQKYAAKSDSFGRGCQWTTDSESAKIEPGNGIRPSLPSHHHEEQSATPLPHQPLSVPIRHPSAPRGRRPLRLDKVWALLRMPEADSALSIFYGLAEFTFRQKHDSRLHLLSLEILPSVGTGYASSALAIRLDNDRRKLLGTALDA